MSVSNEFKNITKKIKQQNIKLKNFKKKLLTGNNGNVIINELSLRQQKRILKSC